MAGLEGSLLSSILNTAGTGLAEPSRTLQKSVRSNDRLFRYGDPGESETEADLSERTEAVLGDIQAGAGEWGPGDHYRHDQVRDINWTMTILANSIKVVSAVLTILAVDQTDR